MCCALGGASNAATLHKAIRQRAYELKSAQEGRRHGPSLEDPLPNPTRFQQRGLAAAHNIVGSRGLLSQPDPCELRLPVAPRPQPRLALKLTASIAASCICDLKAARLLNHLGTLHVHKCRCESRRRRKAHAIRPHKQRCTTERGSLANPSCEERVPPP